MKPQPLNDGFLVIFEGIDGSGKTTQLELARKDLAKTGWSPLSTSRNLGGTPIGEELRKVIKSPLERPSTTNLYISVAIQEALAAGIKTKRSHHELILMDRGPISLAAYEIYGGGLDAGLGWQHVDNGMNQLQPELIILYKTDVKTALDRIHKKAGPSDYFESKPRDYFEKVARGYEEAAKRYPDRIVVIDGDQSAAAAHEQTMQAIDVAFSRKLQA